MCQVCPLRLPPFWRHETRERGAALTSGPGPSFSPADRAPPRTSLFPRCHCRGNSSRRANAAATTTRTAALGNCLVISAPTVVAQRTLSPGGLIFAVSNPTPYPNGHCSSLRLNMGRPRATIQPPAKIMKELRQGVKPLSPFLRRGAEVNAHAPNVTAKGSRAATLIVQGDALPRRGRRTWTPGPGQVPQASRGVYITSFGNPSRQMCLYYPPLLVCKLAHTPTAQSIGHPGPVLGLAPICRVLIRRGLARQSRPASLTTEHAWPPCGGHHRCSTGVKTLAFAATQQRCGACWSLVLLRSVSGQAASRRWQGPNGGHRRAGTAGRQPPCGDAGES